LLPVNGRPISDYVIQSLERSDIETIFVVQDEGVNLQDVLTPSSKCVFFTRDSHHSSLAAGFLFAMEKLAEFYGDSGLITRSIMIVPCDTPLVTSGNINALIRKAADKTADVTVTMIAADRIEKRFPHKNFRSVYLADFKANFAMQYVLFMNGEFIRFNPKAGPGELKFSFQGWDSDVLNRVKNGIDSVENLRHQSHFYNRLFLLWLLTKGYTYYIFRFLVDLAFRRLTMVRAMEYLGGADHMHAAYIESEEVEFSADIDTPEDFQMLLGIQWHNG
jgi:GTP:adenosylcobinamide-phosphate guanylyltransferase